MIEKGSLSRLLPLPILGITVFSTVPLNAQSITSARLVKLWQWAGVDGRGFQTPASSAMIAPNGNLYVAQPREGRVLVRTKSGQAFRVGRFGREPEAFGRPAAFGVIGDTLWVTDIEDESVSLFSSMRGGLLGRFPAPYDGGRVATQGWTRLIASILTDGTLLSIPARAFGQLESMRRSRVPVERLDRAHRVLDTLAWLDAINVVRLDLKSDRRRYILVGGLSPSSEVGVSTSGSTVVSVSSKRGASSSQHVEIVSFDVSSGRRSKYTAILPLRKSTQRTADSVRLFIRGAGRMEALADSSLRLAIRQAVVVPERLAAFSKIIVADDGRFALRLSAEWEKPTRWRLFSRTGISELEIIAPPGFTLLQLTPNGIFGIEKLGERYRIVEFGLENSK